MFVTAPKGDAKLVRPGIYKATLVEVESVPANLRYKAGLRWNFRITTGEFADAIVSRITELPANPDNPAGKMLLGLLGREPKLHELFDPSMFLDQPYRVLVAATQNGSTRVEAVIPETVS